MAQKQEEDWRDKAKCQGEDPTLFYTSNSNVPAIMKAKSICLSGCPVRIECLRRGMYEEWGVWGGLTNIERRRIRRAIRDGKDLAWEIRRMDQQAKKSIGDTNLEEWQPDVEF